MIPPPNAHSRLPTRGRIGAVVLAGVIFAAGCRSASTGDTSPVAPSTASYDLVVGRTGRFLLGLFSSDKSQLVAYGQVSLRFSYLGPTGHPLPKPIQGPSATAGYDPIPGQHLNLATPGPRLVDPSDATGVYRATDITFDRAGIWQVAATVPLKPGGTTTVTSPFEVLASSKIPNVGDQAPATVNPLPGDGTPAKAIDSRASDTIPIHDPELHRTTVAAALAAHRPTIVVISTPTYCISRFCGPVTDRASTLAKTLGDKATFIHLEVWQDFDKSQLNPAAAQWIKPTGTEDAAEPWTFVIDRTGRITHRFDNVAGEDELQAAVDQVTQ